MWMEVRTLDPDVETSSRNCSGAVALTSRSYLPEETRRGFPQNPPWPARGPVCLVQLGPTFAPAPSRLAISPSARRSWSWATSIYTAASGVGNARKPTPAVGPRKRIAL